MKGDFSYSLTRLPYPTKLVVKLNLLIIYVNMSFRNAALSSTIVYACKKTLVYLIIYLYSPAPIFYFSPQHLLIDICSRILVKCGFALSIALSQSEKNVFKTSFAMGGGAIHL